VIFPSVNRSCSLVLDVRAILSATRLLLRSCSTQLLGKSSRLIFKTYAVGRGDDSGGMSLYRGVGWPVRWAGRLQYVSRMSSEIMCKAEAAPLRLFTVCVCVCVGVCVCVCVCGVFTPCRSSRQHRKVASAARVTSSASRTWASPCRMR
jgi:hypothetical protein